MYLRTMADVMKLTERVERFGRIVLEGRRSFRNARGDIEHALDHVSDFAIEPLSLEDFGIKKVDCLKLDRLWKHDDLSGWLEFEEGELAELDQDDLLRELSEFRGAKWARMALKWLDDGVPAIVAVATPEIVEIGDGRGRVNFAIGMGLDCIPAIIMTHKDVK